MKIASLPLARLGPLSQKPAKVSSPAQQIDSVEFSAAVEKPVSSGWMVRAGATVALLGSSLACLAGPASPTILLASGPVAARPAEAAQLAARFQKVDPNVLRLLQNDGVTMGVVRPGQSFLQTGVLPTLQLAEIQAQMPAMQSTARAVQKATAPYAQGIERLKAQGPSQRLGEMQRQRRQVVLETIPNGSLAVPYSIPSLAGVLHDHDGLHKLVQQQNMPKGTTVMAQLVGARSAAQIQEYTQLVEAINGPRLEEARQASLQAATPAQQAAWSKDPGSIPLDLKGFDILVPDLAYVPDGSGGSARVSLLDASVQAAWADGSGKTIRGSSINGQYFFQSRRILVQSAKISAPTAIHEIGHAVEDSVQRHDPQFYGRWQSKLYNAYQRATQSGTVSEYAGTNSAEYIAEGVAHYHENPNLLRQKDAQLFQLTQELLHKAAELGKAPL